jgi:hypothetical protein
MEYLTRKGVSTEIRLRILETALIPFLHDDVIQ